MNPKLHILSAHAGGDIEPTLNSSLLSLIPQVSLHAADAVIVVVAYHGDYRFNDALYGIKKPVILIDMLEYFGAGDPQSSHLLGRQPLPPNMQNHAGWSDLWEYAALVPPALYFKRELRQQDQTDTVLPIEWPCTQPAWPIESKEAFDARPFQVFYNWGYSNALRPKLAGDIYHLMAEGQIEVISSFDHIDAKINEPQPKWISIHSPHTHRTHISEIMRRQAQSKMSVSMPGSGTVCFRDTEAPVHTVPVFVSNDTARSHPWVDGLNCLKIHPESVETMAEQVWHDSNCGGLYPIYVEAQSTIDRYRPHRYFNEYFLPAISQAL